MWVTRSLWHRTDAHGPLSATVPDVRNVAQTPSNAMKLLNTLDCACVASIAWDPVMPSCCIRWLTSSTSSGVRRPSSTHARRLSALLSHRISLAISPCIALCRHGTSGSSVTINRTLSIGLMSFLMESLQKKISLQNQIKSITSSKFYQYIFIKIWHGQRRTANSTWSVIFSPGARGYSPVLPMLLGRICGIYKDHSFCYFLNERPIVIYNCLKYLLIFIFSDQLINYIYRIDDTPANLVNFAIENAKKERNPLYADNIAELEKKIQDKFKVSQISSYRVRI